MSSQRLFSKLIQQIVVTCHKSSTASGLLLVVLGLLLYHFLLRDKDESVVFRPSQCSAVNNNNNINNKYSSNSYSNVYHATSRTRSLRASSLLNTLNQTSSLPLLPSCLSTWRQQDVLQVSQDFQTRLNIEELWHQVTPNNHYPATTGSGNPGVWQCKQQDLFVSPKFNKFVHHIPHFAEVYFQFFSLFLWQSEVFSFLHSDVNNVNYNMNMNNNENLNCIQNVIFDNYASIWGIKRESHTWHAHLVEHTDQFYQIQSIQSPQCMRTISSTSRKSMTSTSTWFSSTSTSTSSSAFSWFSTSTSNQHPLTLSLRENWFLHPSDAMLLTSILLRQSPCQYALQAKYLIHKPIQITLLNRLRTRAIGNSKDVIELLQQLPFRTSLQRHSTRSSSASTSSMSSPFPSPASSTSSATTTTSTSAASTATVHTTVNNAHNKNPVNKVNLLSIDHFTDLMMPRKLSTSSTINSMSPNDRLNADMTLKTEEDKTSPYLFYLEKLQFQDQVRLLHETDVLITIHGAGETNIAFMKPCSIVIEVFPYGFYVPNYFGDLAKSVGVLHYSWQASSQETVLNIKKGFCKTFLQDMMDGKLSSSPTLSADSISDTQFYADQSSLSHCYESSKCRHCVREANAVQINIPRLEQVLMQALEDRKTCIINHPFYNA